MAVTQSKQPTFRLVIPSVQLGVIAALWPDLQVQRIIGKGQFSGASSEQILKYGRLVSQTTGQAYCDWKWGYTPPVTISEIYKDFLDSGVPDISVVHLAYVRKVVVRGRTTFVNLKMGKDTVHPEVYQKLVVDGTYPKQETAQIIRALKNALKQTDAVTDDVLKRIRYSCLVLYRTDPDPTLMNDAYAIYALKQPTMLFIREIFKKWELWDYEYLQKP
jgi:hypothetical protein